VEATFHLPTADDMLFPRGAIGVAYNAVTDQLYVSFCRAVCSPPTAGVVSAFDAGTGAPLGDLFRVTGSYIGGLAYDSVANTIWMGTGDTISISNIVNVKLDGTVLISFPRPYGLFADGLELIGGASLP
jgi:DNA-binding beta-propeller fold protein YncE